MARARNIKPGFFTNEALADVPPLGRILFQGLWCYADREGRLEDRPRKLKVEILPYDDCDVDELLSALAQRGFIRRYKSGESSYIQVVNFCKHQNPHIKESASLIPAPDQHHTSTIQAPEIPEAAGLIPDSLNLIPETNTRAPSALGAFDRFWSAYPKKKSKGDAEKAWRKLNPNEQLQDRILHALEQAKTSGDWQKDGGQFIPHPASWLNAKGWEDDFGPLKRERGVVV